MIDARDGVEYTSNQLSVITKLPTVATQKQVSKANVHELPGLFMWHFDIETAFVCKDDAQPPGRTLQVLRKRIGRSERYEASLVDRGQAPLGHGFEKRLENLPVNAVNIII
jgi:hypothetical protein